MFHRDCQRRTRKIILPTLMLAGKLTIDAQSWASEMIMSSSSYAFMLSPLMGGWLVAIGDSLVLPSLLLTVLMFMYGRIVVVDSRAVSPSGRHRSSSRRQVSSIRISLVEVDVSVKSKSNIGALS